MSSMSRLAALLLAATATPGGITGAGAECLFVAEDRALIEDGVQSTASVASGSGGITKLGRNVLFADGTEVVGDRVHLGNGSSVDDVGVNRLTKGKDVAIRGTDARASLPIGEPFCPIPDVICGGPDVTVARGETRALPPGSYGMIVLDRGATLELMDGAYAACELDADKNAVVIAGEGTTLDLRDGFALGNGSVLGLGAGGTAARVNVAADGLVRFGRHADVTAVLSAPDAQVSIGNGSQFAGTLCAKRFDTGKRTELSCVPGGAP